MEEITPVDDDLWQLARLARRALESRKAPLHELSRLYAVYNPALDAARFCVAALERFPVGACGLASLYVRSLLGRGRVVYGRYRDQGHTFVLLGASEIIDITADQFGGPPIYVGPLRAPWSTVRMPAPPERS